MLSDQRVPMKVGIPKETVAGERRVALVPEVVGRLVKAGHEVVVEGDAGVEAGFPNDAYTAVGASLGDAWAADVVCKVQKPGPAEVGKMREATALVGMLKAATKADLVRQLAHPRAAALTTQLPTRITRARPPDRASSHPPV